MCYGTYHNNFTLFTKPIHDNLMKMAQEDNQGGGGGGNGKKKMKIGYVDIGSSYGNTVAGLGFWNREYI